MLLPMAPVPCTVPVKSPVGELISYSNCHRNGIPHSAGALFSASEIAFATGIIYNSVN